MASSAAIASDYGNYLFNTIEADGLIIPFLECLVAANRTLIWHEKQSCVHRSHSLIWIRRSLCGSVRGWPVLSSHFFPGGAPHIGHRTLRASLTVRSRFMAVI